MENIVIIGFMGSGKTRVGKKLSQDLGLPFVDVDKTITKKLDMSLKDIYEKFGEPFYRALETMTIKELAQDPEKKVISLGSGLPMQEQNQGIIPTLGTIVYIKGSYETIRKRLKDTNSPFMEQEDCDTKLQKLLKQRGQVYEKFADVTVETGIKPFEDLVKEIHEKLELVEKNS